MENFAKNTLKPLGAVHKSRDGHEWEAGSGKRPDQSHGGGVFQINHVILESVILFNIFMIDFL